MTASHQKSSIKAPNNHKKVLLHVCCAVCAGDIIRTMVDSGLEIMLFFYNPNIHPEEEYEKRKGEMIRFAKKNNIPYVQTHYDPKNWFQRIKGLENEPERGARCQQCFLMRLETTALYAYENGFPVFATTLGISRWKNIDQVNECGIIITSKYAGLMFWDYNWRKHGGSQRMQKIAQSEQFYRQHYCGCTYSIK